MQTRLRTGKHRTPAQREKILAAYHQSELTQSQFARGAGVSLSALQLWLRKADALKSPGGAAFVSLPNLFSTPPAAPAFRLLFPRGLVLEIQPGFAPGELKSLLRLARAL